MAGASVMVLSRPSSQQLVCCCSSASNQPRCFQKDEKDQRDKKWMTRVVISTLAAGLLLASPFSGDEQALAASGGRIGGQSFRSAPRAPPRAAPPPRSGPRINNSRTNIYINPPSYGYGYGYGWSPFSYFFNPAPAVAVGVGGFDFVPLILGLAVLGWISRSVLRRGEDDDYYD